MTLKNDLMLYFGSTLLLVMNRKEILNRLSEEVKLRGFSPKTMKSYIYNSENFLSWIIKSSGKVSNNTVRSYFLDLHSRNYDVNTIRLIMASIKFMFRA